MSLDRNTIAEIDDLKAPRVGATATGAAISTKGSITHLPDYRGAILWFDRATKQTKVVWNEGVDHVAADAGHVYAVNGKVLFKIRH